MVERGYRSSFLLEASPSFRVYSQIRGKQLEGDDPSQLGITSPVDLAHSPRTQLTEDFIVREYFANHRVPDRTIEGN
jgi:hypothetical protein